MVWTRQRGFPVLEPVPVPRSVCLPHSWSPSPVCAAYAKNETTEVIYGCTRKSCKKKKDVLKEKYNVPVPAGSQLKKAFCMQSWALFFYFFEWMCNIRSPDCRLIKITVITKQPVERWWVSGSRWYTIHHFPYQWCHLTTSDPLKTQISSSITLFRNNFASNSIEFLGKFVDYHRAASAGHGSTTIWLYKSKSYQQNQ